MLNMFPLLFTLTCLPLFETFLIDGTTKTPLNAGLSLTDGHYYRLLDMLNEEIHSRRQLEQYVMNIVNSNAELQKGVADLKLTCGQTLPQDISQLQNETQAFKNENVELKRELGTLKSEIIQLNTDLNAQKVNMEKMENEINTLKRLKSFQQLYGISALANKSSNMEETVHNIDVKLNQVILENEARKQDFIALYNKSLTTDLSLSQKHQNMELSQQLLNQSLNALDAKTNTNINNIITDLHSTEAKLNTSMEMVSMSACSNGQTVNTNDSLIFADYLEMNGIPNHGVYSNGVFECKLRGLYFIFVSIVSSNDHAYGFIYKNNKKISTVYVQGSAPASFRSGSGMAVVELVPGDRLYARAKSSFTVDPVSCFSLAKIN